MQPIYIHSVLGGRGEEGGCLIHFIWMSCSPQGVVCTLHEGDDFGKLALVNDAPRAASIVLREDNCHFLRVDKEDFNRILRVSWENKLWRKDILFFPFLNKKGFGRIVHPTELWQRDAWTKGLCCETGMFRVLCTFWRPDADTKYFAGPNTSVQVYSGPYEWTMIAVTLAKYQSLRSFLLVPCASFSMPSSTLLSSRVVASLCPVSFLWSTFCLFPSLNHSPTVRLLIYWVLVNGNQCLV